MASSETSWIAVEHRTEADRTTATAQLRRVPLALTYGSEESVAGAVYGSMPATTGGMVTRAGGVSAAFAPRSAPARTNTGAGMKTQSMAPSPAMARMSMPAGAPPPPPKAGGFLGRLFRRSAEAESASPAKDLGAEMDSFDAPAFLRDSHGSAACQGASDALYDLLLSQAADGRFSDSAPLRALLASAAPATLDDATATALALRVLERRFGDRQGEWNLPAGKARRWLAGQAGVPAATVLDGWV